MKQIWISKTGAPEVLQLIEAPDPLPKAHEVRIRVKSSGINFADIMARLGLYPDAPPLPTVVGYEVSGEIDKLGEQVKGFEVGQRVVALTKFGGYSDTICVSSPQVFQIPETYSFEMAAALPVNYLTAYQMLIVMGSLNEGDTVLIHSAGGGVGFAAIDLCHLKKANVIALASKHKHSRLSEKGIKHIIDPSEIDYVQEVLRLTNGKGVEIILDPVGGDSWGKGLKVLAPTGRLVVYGFSAAATGKKKNTLLALKAMLSVPWFSFNPISLMNQNRGVLGVNVGHLWNAPHKVYRWCDHLMKWANEGKLHPEVDKSFSFSEAAKAHHYIQDRRNIGKVLLVPTP